MNKMELIKKLREINISPDAYSLEGGIPWARYCMEENYGRWSVYFSERGKKFEEKLFYNEDEACKYLYDMLVSDPTTKEK